MLSCFLRNAMPNGCAESFIEFFFEQDEKLIKFILFIYLVHPFRPFPQGALTDFAVKGNVYETDALVGKPSQFLPLPV